MNLVANAVIEAHDSTSMGWIIGWPLWIVGLLVVLVFAVGVLWAGLDDGDGVLSFFGGLLMLVFVGLLVLMLSPFGMYPSGGSDFHSWKVKQGVVVDVGKRLVPAGEKSMEEKVVITFQGSDQEYGVTDTRAALLKKGDTAVIKCKKAYDWGSVPGYDCKWVQRIPK